MRRNAGEHCRSAMYRVDYMPTPAPLHEAHSGVNQNDAIRVLKQRIQDRVEWGRASRKETKMSLLGVEVLRCLAQAATVSTLDTNLLKEDQ